MDVSIKTNRTMDNNVNVFICFSGRWKLHLYIGMACLAARRTLQPLDSFPKCYVEAIQQPGLQTPSNALPVLTKAEDDNPATPSHPNSPLVSMKAAAPEDPPHQSPS